MSDLAPSSLSAPDYRPPCRDWHAPAEGVAWSRRNAQTVEQLDDTYRSRYGVTRSEIARRMTLPVDRGARVLEVGAAHGVQLEILRRLGFARLVGCDLSPGALAMGRGHRVAADALALPFRARAFDFVFTSGVLIHIAEPDLPAAVREMARVSARWLAGMEYWAPMRMPWLSSVVPPMWQDEYPAIVQGLTGWHVRYCEAFEPPHHDCAPCIAYLLERP